MDKYRRPLTYAEKKVNLDGLVAKIKEARVKIDELYKKQIEYVLTEVKKKLDRDGTEGYEKVLDGIKVDIKELSKVQKELFEYSKQSASSEMKVPVPKTDPSVVGIFTTKNADMEKIIKADIALMLSKVALTGKDDTTKILKTVALGLSRSKNAIDTLSITGVIDVGRRVVFEQYPEMIYAFEFSAILDDKTTKICKDLDGLVVEPMSKEYYRYSPPRHYNCRSIRVEILNDEPYRPKITKNLPNSQRDIREEDYF